MRVVLFHWKSTEFPSRLERLTLAGFQAAATDRPSPAFLKQLGENPPDAILIDLSRLPSQGRDIGLMIRKRKTTCLIPLVFVNGDPAKVDRVKSLLPDAIYTGWDKIGDAVNQAVNQAPDNPIVHDSTFAGYAGKPLATKLGIKKNMTVALVHAPDNFESTIGETPGGVQFILEPSIQCNLSVWFLGSIQELDNHIKKIEAQTHFGPVWMTWKKKRKGFKTDLTQQMVRETGLANNMVDYKICSIDDQWSGLLFRYRKTE